MAPIRVSFQGDSGGYIFWQRNKPAGDAGGLVSRLGKYVDTVP